MKSLWLLVALAACEAFPGARQSTGCSGSITLQAGESVRLTAPSGYGTSGVSCFWEAVSPAGTTMTLSCPDFRVLSNGQYCADVFYFSPSGSYYDYRYYCGSGTLTVSTSSNVFKAAFYASEKGSAVYSYFDCVLKVVASACECGSKGTARVVGGQNADVGEWPWQAALRRKLAFKEVFCGATLIHQEWLVTSAHCAVEYPKEDLYVTLGDHQKDQNGETPFERSFEIAEVIVHENYNANTVDNDIALIRLSSAASYSRGVGPICLPFQFASLDFQGQTGTVTGWGRTDYQGSTSNVLQEVELPILTTAECQQYLKSTITNNMMCTYKAGQDACLGDSGGPLIWSRRTTCLFWDSDRRIDISSSSVTVNDANISLLQVTQTTPFCSRSSPSLMTFGRVPEDQVSLINRMYAWPHKIQEDFRLAEARLSHKRDVKETALKARVAAFENT
ncbi:venom serine protease 34-like [Penaeus monodon]|uniref:venom serine protease 34-like n=1 Tax=Penaeus monodon TaxID=6687 RepID=UPI0018A6F88A|nr:venom serine protease 34-like [Penaeus monodon]